MRSSPHRRSTTLERAPGAGHRVRPTEAFAALAQALLRADGVSETQRAGTRRLAFRGRMFAAAIEGELVVRWPPAEVAALVDEGIGRLDQPRGGSAREWARVRGSEDLWLALVTRALEFARDGVAPRAYLGGR